VRHAGSLSELNRSHRFMSRGECTTSGQPTRASSITSKIRCASLCRGTSMDRRITWMRWCGASALFVEPEEVHQVVVYNERVHISPF
jgi:hypothetical protein